MVRGFIAGLALAAALAASPLQDARKLYNRTDYSGALKLLISLENKDAAAWALLGQAHFMSADYRKSVEALEKASALEPGNAGYVHWLGRAWGRRAESATPFMAPGYATKSRGFFEKAVEMDPRNKEALNDLFDYYLQAPGFLGGGLNRAEALVKRIAALDAAEGYYASAQLADKRKQFDKAEQSLRRAVELAPKQVGRVIDLAKYLSKLGRVQESEAVFAQAEKLEPNNPRILFERAETYIRDQRNLNEARQMLQKYISSSNLTPDDPPRSTARELLRKAGA
jgi:tetratricopeptide (TPR) repeat protein